MTKEIKIKEEIKENALLEIFKSFKSWLLLGAFGVILTLVIHGSISITGLYNKDTIYDRKSKTIAAILQNPEKMSDNRLLKKISAVILSNKKMMIENSTLTNKELLAKITSLIDRRTGVFNSGEGISKMYGKDRYGIYRVHSVLIDTFDLNSQVTYPKPTNDIERGIVEIERILLDLPIIVKGSTYSILTPLLQTIYKNWVNGFVAEYSRLHKSGELRRTKELAEAERKSKKLKAEIEKNSNILR